jgi:hypothetical protein
MSADVTARVLNYLVADLRQHLPSGVGIRVTAHTKWTTVQRADDGSEDFHGLQTQVVRDDRGRPTGGQSRGVAVRNLGPSLPLIPRSARRQMAAKHALDILLGLAYPQPQLQGDGFRFSRSTDYGVLTADGPSGVVVSYHRPGSDERVELTPLPQELFR